MLLIIFAVVFLSITIVIQLASAHHNDITEGTKFLPPLSVVSTRNTTGDLIVNVTEQANFTIDKFGGSCPPEMAIYIHGFNREETEAGEELNRIQTSLNYNNYRTPLVGFSWDSKTGWETAKNNAKENGPKLAQFIIDFKNKCSNTNIRLIAHSLGAAVVNSTLVSLDTNPTLRDSSYNNSKIIKSLYTY